MDKIVARKKIAIFRYGDQIDIHLFNIANLLAESGHDVYIYTCFSSENISKKYLNKKIIKTNIEFTNYIEKIFSYLYGFLSYRLRINNLILLNPIILRKSKSIIRDQEFDYVIAIEKKALLWVNYLNLTYKTIYYSLELYIPGHPILSSKHWKNLQIKEKKIHKKCIYTIIQDDYRAEALYLANGVSIEQVPYFKIPVSINQQVIKEKFNYFNFKYNLKESDIIILYFGGGGFNRMFNLNKISHKLKNGYKLIIHGYKNIAKNDLIKLNNVIISEDYLDEEGINVIMASCHIGMVFYSNDNLNNLHTAFSSEKIARYLQFGVPFISLNNISYQFLKKQYDCCELIENYDDIPDSIDKILANYDYYQSNAFRAFKNLYYFPAKSIEFMNFMNR